MSVNNSLATKQNQQNNGEISYNANGETVKLSMDMIRNYLVSGNANKVTNQEVVMFLSLCKFQHLNPFIREAYLIKYGDAPATVVVGKEVLLKRAMRSPKYEGMQAGVIVVTADGKVTEREGTFVLDGEQLVGGWAKVFMNNYINPVYSSVSIGEYSTGKSNWLSKPATMIRKVAMAQALREAFPEEMSALYDQAEMGSVKLDNGESVADIPLAEAPIEVPSESPVVASEPVKVIEPEPVVKAPSKRKQASQAGVEDIMFPPILNGEEPPIEI